VLVSALARVGKAIAKFIKLNPRDVVLGRRRSALETRKPYVEAVKGRSG
jgi:hypothetical protein